MASAMARIAKGIGNLELEGPIANIRPLKYNFSRLMIVFRVFRLVLGLGGY
jgi:hypothetical protein